LIVPAKGTPKKKGKIDLYLRATCPARLKSLILREKNIRNLKGKAAALNASEPK
jgi:hypothetical protein